jgi:chromosome segregation ATPase
VTPPKIASATITAVLALGAVLIGGGTPLSPKEIADATSTAARNSKVAAENTARAVEATRALEEIARNVRAQRGFSEQLLEVQLGLEASSRHGADSAVELEDEIVAIGQELAQLEAAVRRMSDASSDAEEQVDTLADSAIDLDGALAHLEARFEKVVKESRELARKARGFEKLRDPLP